MGERPEPGEGVLGRRAALRGPRSDLLGVLLGPQPGDEVGEPGQVARRRGGQRPGDVELALAVGVPGPGGERTQPVPAVAQHRVGLAGDPRRDASGGQAVRAEDDDVEPARGEIGDVRPVAETHEGDDRGVRQAEREVAAPGTAVGVAREREVAEHDEHDERRGLRDGHDGPDPGQPVPDREEEQRPVRPVGEDLAPREPGTGEGEPPGGPADPQPGRADPDHDPEQQRLGDEVVDGPLVDHLQEPPLRGRERSPLGPDRPLGPGRPGHPGCCRHRANHSWRTCASRFCFGTNVTPGSSGIGGSSESAAVEHRTTGSPAAAPASGGRPRCRRPRRG